MDKFCTATHHTLPTLLMAIWAGKSEIRKIPDIRRISGGGISDFPALAWSTASPLLQHIYGAGFYYHLPYQEVMSIFFISPYQNPRFHWLIRGGGNFIEKNLYKDIILEDDRVHALGVLGDLVREGVFLWGRQLGKRSYKEIPPHLKMPA